MQEGGRSAALFADKNGTNYFEMYGMIYLGCNSPKLLTNNKGVALEKRHGK